VNDDNVFESYEEWPTTITNKLSNLNCDVEECEELDDHLSQNCSAEEDAYQDLDTVLITSDQQKESFQSLIENNKQNKTISNEENSYEPEEYNPTIDDDDNDDDDNDNDDDDDGGGSGAHSKSDNSDVNDSRKLKREDSHGAILKGVKSPTSSIISGGIDDDLNITTKVSNKDDDITERSQDLSMSELVVSELLQSIIAERESIVKTTEAQKSQLKSELIKTHELEMKELHLKYKSKIKKLRLKQKEEYIAMKIVIEKLQSELTGVYKQNSKLADYMKKSCKREEKFNQVVTMLQDTVNNLESELTEVKTEVVGLRKRENELLASLELAKEKLRTYEAT